MGDVFRPPADLPCGGGGFINQELTLAVLELAFVFGIQGFQGLGLGLGSLGVSGLMLPVAAFQRRPNPWITLP